jgi:hypothetical protein
MEWFLDMGKEIKDNVYDTPPPNSARVAERAVPTRKDLIKKV